MKLRFSSRRLSLVAILAVITLLAFAWSLPATDAASTGQGKGGEVIAKPTPTPKKSTPKNRSTSAKSNPSSAGDDRAEISFWESIKNSADPEDFKAYLEQYPKGKFAALAKNRLKNLENKNGSTDTSVSNSNSGTSSTTNPATTNPGPPTSGSTKPSTTSDSNIVVPAGETKEDAPRHYTKGQEYYKYDFEAAEKEFGIASRLDPSNLDYHFWYGLVLRYECKWAQAETELKEAVRTPTNPSYHIYLAQVLERNKKYGEAEAALRDALRVQPDYTSAQFDLGSMLARHGKWAEADRAFREFIQLNPVDGHWHYGLVLARYNRYAEAELEFKEAMRADPKAQALSHFSFGNLLAAQKRWAEAEAEMREGLRTYCDGKCTSDSLWRDLAKLFEDQGKPTQADAVYQEGMKAFPQQASIRDRYGEFLIRQKRWTDAEGDYREALRLSPSDPDYFAGLGDALKGQNKLAEAEGEYRKALHINAYNVRAHRGFADALEKQNRAPEIEAAYRALVKAGCDSAPAHADYGDYLVRQKRWKEAEAEYKTAAELDPRNIEYPEKLKAATAAQKK